MYDKDFCFAKKSLSSIEFNIPASLKSFSLVLMILPQNSIGNL